MRARALLVVLPVAGLIAGCTGGGHSSSSTGTPGALGSTAVAATGPRGGTPSSATSLHPSVSAGSSKPHSSGSSKSSSATHSTHGPRVLPPDGTNISGVICDYVSQADVTPILPGAEKGQENDLATVAVSYCNFNASPYGTVSVGVKNMGTQATASSQVHGKYNVMSSEPNQSKRTFTINGEFAFEISSTTPLQSGKTIYAMNGQGSRGKWYVSIQYYAHQSVSTSAMQQLMQAVLEKVPA